MTVGHLDLRISKMFTMDSWCDSPRFGHDNHFNSLNMAATTRASGCAALALYRVMNSTQKTY